MRFDDFTDAARRAVEEANATAARDRHPQLTAEQLLLSMVDARDTDAMRVLVYLGTATATLRQALADEVLALPRVTQERARVLVMATPVEATQGFGRPEGMQAFGGVALVGFLVGRLGRP